MSELYKLPRDRQAINKNYNNESKYYYCNLWRRKIQKSEPRRICIIQNQSCIHYLWKHMEENITDWKYYRKGISLVCTHLFLASPDNKPTIVGVLHSWRKRGGESSLFLVSRNGPWYFPMLELIHACNQAIKI